MRRWALAFVLAAAFWSSAARADILIYAIPGGRATFQFEGEAKAGAGRTVTFRHTQFGTFYFGYDDVKFYKSPSTLNLVQTKLKKAKDDPEACLEAARWALHHGLLDKFYEAVSTAWRLKRDHPTVERLARLKQKMNAPLPVVEEQKSQLRKYVPTAKNMEFAQSAHFLLMHNTKESDSTTLATRRKQSKTPAEQRLELLEKVYESFLLKFYLEGFEVEVPKERLMVILFADRDDFLAFCEATESERKKAAGFYDKRSNIAVFYDQGTAEGYKDLDEAKKNIAEAARVAKLHRHPATAQLVRYSKSLELVIELAKLNRDIEVVTHECTHHMAAVTRLMPNESSTPVWVAEGLATYFESPREAAWAGIGTVNESRLDLYRAMAADTEHSNVEFIASDNIFMRAGNLKSELHGYGQSWALTHFLMARHFDELIRFYKLLAARKAKKAHMLFPPDENLTVFKKAFGDDLKVLNAEWRLYMKSLKTDVERIMDGE
ncbi:MAG TPA: DUF1570 domain-containing protein [Thermoguttaceae bacterium]|nr:DUF1570 domain-containing protein [Thermoguttaceae bacterium]